MGIFDKKIGVVFLKENSGASAFIDKMQELQKQTTDENLKWEIEKQIKLASYGEAGEQNIRFELENSGMDMYVLHDIYLSTGNLSAQIDYLVITKKITFVIECKNLIGNIEVDNLGNFVRTYELFGRKVREGMYSPVTQNRRHLDVIKALLGERRGNFLSRSLFEHAFCDNYKSLVVLANPKTFLNVKYAKKEIKENIIRADQLIETIRKFNEADEAFPLSNKELEEKAQLFLSLHQSEHTDYETIYRKTEESVKNAKEAQTQNTEEVNRDDKNPNTDRANLCPRCGSPLVLRTATKGNYSGNQFYGCSAYPKCRYIRNIGEQKV